MKFGYHVLMHNTMQETFSSPMKLSTIILMNEVTAGYSCRVGGGQVPQLPEANGNLTRLMVGAFYRLPVHSKLPITSLSGGIVWLGVTFNQPVNVLFYF